MSDFRSLNSFGIAGLLREDCTVYYANHFTSRAVGRISDLISAKLHESNADELRVRALLLYSLFEAYAVQGVSFGVQSSITPISIEVGVDSKNVGIGVSFHWIEGKPPQFDGLERRVMGQGYQTQFDELLGFLRQHCGQVVVRYEEKERRIEIDSLLSRQEGDQREPLLLHAVKSEVSIHAEASEYVEMGDLDYTALLKEQTAEAAPIAGEAESARKFAGDPAKAAEEARMVQGGERAEDETVRKFGADTPVTAASVGRLEDRIRELEAENAKLKGGKDGEEEEGWGLGIFKQLFGGDEKEEAAEKTFKGERAEALENVVVKDPLGGDEFSEDAVTITDGAPNLDFLDEIPAELKLEEEQNQASISQVIAANQKVIGNLNQETDGHLDEIEKLAKDGGPAGFKKIVQEIEKEVEANKSKKWTDGLMKEYLQEKAKLADLEKALHLKIRSRELEFKNSERALMEEMRRRDEQLRRRATLLDRKSEQIVQLNATIDRLKKEKGSKEETESKMKANQSQKLLQMKEEELKAATLKMKEMENKLIVAQSKASRPAVDPQTQAKLLAAERKVEEFRRINQRLTENLNSTKDKANDREAQDHKRKADAAERQLTEVRRSLEKANLKLKESQEAERKVQQDLNRVLEENKKLRATGAKGSGDGTGQAA